MQRRKKITHISRVRDLRENVAKKRKRGAQFSKGGKGLIKITLLTYKINCRITDMKIKEAVLCIYTVPFPCRPQKYFTEVKPHFTDMGRAGGNKITQPE